MAGKPFHLAWFLQGSSIAGWGDPFAGNIARDWMSAGAFLDLARAMERACFDYVLIEDSIYVGENWKNSREIFLANGMCAPRQEPSVVATLMAAATTRLGIVPTLSTFAYHPYLTSRIVGSLDQISGGRGGWNMVTGSSDLSAMNFGMDALPEHDARYLMAEEYIQICKGLWGSWEPGAIVADRDSGLLIDHTKVHTIDFKGEYYASRGPLNSGPLPQGRPVIAQAGGSKMGKAFAARHADTIVAAPRGVAAMKKYRDDIRAEMMAAGRDPDDCKVLFLLQPIVTETKAEAAEKIAMRREFSEKNIDRMLARFGWSTNLDLSDCDLDAPIGELTTNGHQSSLAQFLDNSKGKTLRQAIVDHTTKGYCVDVVGTPDTCAGMMAEIMEEIGGDGFLIEQPNVHRKAIASITDGLVPELMHRGLTRKAYAHEQLRDNLLDF
ncbi:NtaA/DmoA family FMN-dependent monooxygenase [Oharaeibacter diazotrophicus]|uniref:FMN-dependent oxidoreductase (Nitrilotriacetate monooxygenase family) n=1 Tax=Oharaeibacter diazotrophicus TaxID=1920512 RepID=A0A4R6RMV4_9HYPH|nr:NtaA/DmoA family FMN-dependent monooxygenase [Oharaeibacter diazotrophicus]TDP87377.1 FMN-dependent oxidoreductase (nitrilotriacetate monooxygenase family) [Oharaeibacter diazotrophicus]BBE70679.1 putative monooxygenase MoxC [Pleomorphomonas sp. SM30]GLS77426.1 dibenzothiophene desulfurization enzyme A [Oharaeibacter diazotrophicus]